MARIRPAAIAGQFYEGDGAALSASVARFFNGVSQGDGVAPKAVIAPHAGHIYSGGCAAQAYARLLPDREKIERIILLGPCHRVAVRGLATTSAAFWETPMGRVAIDQKALSMVAGLPQVSVNDEAHRHEHSLEVHLPFIQHCFANGVKLVPFAVGSASNEDVAEVIEKLWGGGETRVVISTDLSHFLDYEAAQALDVKTAASIERLDWQAIGREQACGRIPMSGLLTIAKRRGMRIERVGLVNSGDTAGSRDRVVGYGAWVLNDAHQGETQGTKQQEAEGDPAVPYGPLMLDLAGRTLHHAVRAGKPPKVNTDSFPPALKAVRGTFVTIEKGGQLRGCIGTLEAHRPLIEDLVENTYKAGFRDPRFKPLSEEELDMVEWSISILTPNQAMAFDDEVGLLKQLRPSIDGLIIQDGRHRATFLPQVWVQIPKPVDFLARLKQKAGLATNHWSNEFKAWRYQVTKITREPQ